MPPSPTPNMPASSLRSTNASPAAGSSKNPAVCENPGIPGPTAATASRSPLAPSYPPRSGPASTPAALHKPMLSHAMAKSPLSTYSALHKYAKIQPAIAIKPKPGTALGATLCAQKTAFNPRYNPTLSLLLALRNDELPAASINTLKKWILPPRPRPGRKPVPTQVSETPAVSEEERKRLGHKKHKLSKAAGADQNCSLGARPLLSPASSRTSLYIGLAPPISTLSSRGSVSAGASASESRHSSATRPRSAAASSSSVNANASPKSKQSDFSSLPRPGGESSPIPSKRVAELQTTYLAKLKEQELVHNYIDILTSQIKELKFVQSGVITFDALNSRSSTRHRAHSPPPPDQLDNINNVRDLDAFLAHLTTQSNVIHSVTKKFVGDSLKDGSHLRLQINHYLELKANHPGSQPPFPRFTESRDLPISEDYKCPSNPQHEAVSGVSKTHNFNQPTALQQTQSNTLTNDDSPSSFFTSGFLRPVGANLFDQEDGLVEIINERDPFSGSMGYVDQKRQGSVAEGGMDIVNVPPELKQLNAKGSKKLGCGFCGGDTPCLCFDVDSVFGEK